MISIYTDGSCLMGGDWEGGWAYFIVRNDMVIHKKAGCAVNTTNNRMEFMAIIEGLRYAYNEQLHLWGEDLYLCSDSEYILNPLITGKYKFWKRNQWRMKTEGTRKIKNIDLWVQLIQVYEQIGSVKIRVVKGHSGDRWNDEADKYAVNIRKKAKGYYYVKSDIKSNTPVSSLSLCDLKMK